MTDRVLSTELAKSTVTNMKNLLNGDFSASLTTLKGQGETLSNPEVWDGMKATQFRNETWPGAKSALDDLLASIQAMQAQIESITTNIFLAG